MEIQNLSLPNDKIIVFDYLVAKMLDEVLGR